VNKPDIFVQLDWMADNTHSHQLSSVEIQVIVNAFANSPFVSRTGSVGINLHVDHGPASILNFNTNTTWGNLSRARQLAEVTNLGTGIGINYNWSAFDAIKNQPFVGFKSTGRSAIFHYAIAAHQISTLANGGIARSNPSSDFTGSDFIISLGSFENSVGTPERRSGALMHELGHNLGLLHGGGDGIDNKPPGSVPPSSVVMTPWNDFGSDEAECRTYRIEDLAGNSLDLIMKVRRERDEMEIGILALRYDHGKDAPSPKNEDASLPKNTIEFEQLRGRGLDHCLLAVRQEVRLGRGEERSSLDASYTVLDDETWIKLVSPVGNQEIDRHGLVLIRIVTNKGTLVLEY
jgi:hypothetical protein